MKHDIIGLPSFSVIGQEESGPANASSEWVPKLWARTLGRAKEVEHLGFQGCWGLMSDADEFLSVWKEKGRYLAGWQVPRDTQAFGDWKVWTIPTSSWLRVEMRLDQFDQAMAFLREEFFPNQSWVTTGSGHEYYPDTFCNVETDSLMFCLPIAPKT
jgi:hypothetical protein